MYLHTNNIFLQYSKIDIRSKEDNANVENIISVCYNKQMPFIGIIKYFSNGDRNADNNCRLR